MNRTKGDEEEYWNSSKFKAFTFDDEDDELSQVGVHSAKNHSLLLNAFRKFLLIFSRLTMLWLIIFRKACMLVPLHERPKITNWSREKPYSGSVFRVLDYDWLLCFGPGIGSTLWCSHMIEQNCLPHSQKMERRDSMGSHNPLWGHSSMAQGSPTRLHFSGSTASL